MSKLILSLFSIIVLCSCRGNIIEITKAKYQLKDECYNEVPEGYAGACQLGVDFFVFSKMVPSGAAEDMDKIRQIIKSREESGIEKCEQFSSGTDEEWRSCKDGVILAAEKARQIFLQARVGEKDSSSEIAINDNNDNNRIQLGSKNSNSQIRSVHSI